MLEHTESGQLYIKEPLLFLCILGDVDLMRLVWKTMTLRQCYRYQWTIRIHTQALRE